MKLLVIGIDGGTLEILQNMPMPFTKSLIEMSCSRNLEEDLLSRGWAEVLTGHHASVNKGFYLMPMADQTFNFSASYSKKDMVENSDNLPIWKRINDLGASVGMMNVPTTGPADNVEGFIVAGGGGGISSSGSVPEGMIYPPDCASTLERMNYVFDVRLPGGTKTAPDFFSKITQSENIQKNTFLELNKKYDADFGFHCFRITTEVQYLARYDIELCMQAIKECKEKGVDFTPKTESQKMMLAHYQSLDENIRDLFETLKPENYILVSDHATALLEHEGNLDVWLHKNGYLNLSSEASFFMSRVVNYVKRRVREFLGMPSFPGGVSLVRRPITRIARKRTKAFGTFYDTGNFAGIFVNDESRFGGPIKGDAEIKKMVDKICEDFNSDAEVKKYRMKAEPYRSMFCGARFQNLMPDIRIRKPDSIYFSSRRWSFIVENPNLDVLKGDLEGIRYPHSGAKGSNPLFVYNKELDSYVDDNDPDDLTSVYKLVVRYFLGQSERSTS